MPVAAYIAYPAAAGGEGSRYAFPYHDAAYGEFEAMLAPGEMPRFADPDARYPLIVLSHGYSAHGIFDVGHAHGLASEGYVVAVPFYGDERTATPNTINHHTAYLRPLMTRALIDAIAGSEAFGDNVDVGNVGISGHSYGGYTALAMAGGRYQANPSSVTDTRVRAAVAAAPWVGGSYGGNELLAFGERNGDLGRVMVPVLTAYGSADDVTPAEYTLPAMKQLSGPTYVIELVGQPHVFEGGSWEDRDNWERLFFAAYLKNDEAALEALATTVSMKGGNGDRQLFDYQRTDLP
jgi:predicted dienelactone hydrolase